MRALDGVAVSVPAPPAVGVRVLVPEEDGDAVASAVLVKVSVGERVCVSVASGVTDGVSAPVPLIVCEVVAVDEGDLDGVAVTEEEAVLVVDGSEMDTTGVDRDVRNELAES